MSYAGYRFGDPRLAREKHQHCQHAVLTKESCTATATEGCRECGEPMCSEHLSYKLCVECQLDREMVVVAAPERAA